jgi:hypothetical protein
LVLVDLDQDTFGNGFTARVARGRFEQRKFSNHFARLADRQLDCLAIYGFVNFNFPFFNNIGLAAGASFREKDIATV